MFREWLYSTLSTHVPLTAYVGDNIIQTGSELEAPAHKPFLIYRLGVQSPSLRGDDATTKRIQPVQLFVHDTPGDYKRIDTILDILKSLLDTRGDSSIICCTWLEASEDMRDDVFQTITRYARLELRY